MAFASRSVAHPIIALISLSFLIVAPVGAAAASPSEEQAVELITTLADEAVAILSNEAVTLSEREARFHRLLADNFAIKQIGRFVLGRYWKRASEAERQQYLDLFSDFVVKKYARLFGGYAGESYQINGSRVNPKDDQDVIVKLIILRNDDPIFKTAWRIKAFDGRPLISDIFVENISMLMAQRDEFAAVLKQGGVTHLNNQLQDMIVKLETDTPSQ